MKSSIKQIAVVVCAVVIAGAALLKIYALALIVGIVAGAYLLVAGMSSGGSLGNARRYGQTPADNSTRIGVGLAAAGIAAASIGQPHFPLSFRVFYGLCLVAGCVLAIVLAFLPAKK
ncbi:hypothetical protein CCAX7_22580 [Capsulimonas corticalis]|uniref:Uncharacterized protein n=1 Tax=Capsulimonas corticalis TaxID=2219043 RepID=A0A402CUY3_9BACT|nr:hypothetical protein [Capsulimonas corticalis]BDI30207.1 hypothetical protein CCAX7_22580 [Capsulimonas corticalis]